MDKKINSSDVGERIIDTKKEIVQLSEELERLIKSNAGLSYINFERGHSYGKSDDIKECVGTKDEVTLNKVTNKRTVSSNKKNNVSSKTFIHSGAKSDMKYVSSCNKNVSHNKEVTREFMRQQKEKREEERKKIASKNKVDQELKKQKLLELQQKSLALVQRNLQLKRERSKSRERTQQIRIDKTTIINSTGSSLHKKSSTDIMPIKKCASEVSSKKTIKLQGKSIITSRQTNEVQTDHNPSDKSIPPKFTNLNDARLSLSGNNTNFSIIMPQKDSSKKDWAARKIQACFRDYRTRKQLETRRTQLKIKGKGKPIKESKETQTFTLEQIDIPTWLQPPTIDPYPCNFINTIKKKLHLVVNAPVRCDVGTQSSIMKTKANIQQSYEDIFKFSTEHLGNNEKVKSHSQKVKNLDAGALQHFVLTQFRDKDSQINKEQLKSDSESDTSKNIPEISIESVLVSDEKLICAGERSVNVLPASAEEIKKLTLRKQMDKDVPNENMSKKSYTFSFSEEHDTKNTNIPSKSAPHCNKYIKSPRDSIISFNISNDGEEPSVVSQKSRQLQESILGEEIITEKSNSSSEREKSRRKLIFSSKESIETRDVDNDANDDKTDFENIDSSEYSLRTLSDRVSNSLKTSPVLQFSRENENSSHSSSHSIKICGSLGKQDKLNNRKIGLSVENISKTSVERLLKNDDPSELIITSSTNSRIVTTSSKFTNSINFSLSSEMKGDKNENSQSEIKPHSSLNFLQSAQSKASNSRDKLTTDLSEADDSNLASKISEFILNASDNDKKMAPSVKSAQNQYFSENSKSKDRITNEKEINCQAVKDIQSRLVQSKSNTNEIHLKFEAEVHLLNDFNESLKQFMAVEKAFESLKNKNESSFRNGSKTSSALIFSQDSKVSSNLSGTICSTINTSRGSDFDEAHLGDDSLLKTHSKSNNNLELSSMQSKAFKPNTSSLNENIPNNLAGLSVKMFEQFIKDEDIRIENLKTIIKIREQALLDRTKGELAWLEIQRKHLKETGKLYEASLVKKKQRGILLKHQQERREMQRLKQLQKIESNERKTILKEQKNLIKAKLTSEKLMSEMKIQTPRKQRLSGPMKVFKASESHSETSLSRRASDAEEIFSITSRSRSIKLSEIDSSKELVLKEEDIDVKSFENTENIENMKRALMVRQASLMKRRKAVEDLLKRHQKLLEEEKKIKELEMAANAIIMQFPSTSSKSNTSREPRINNHLEEMTSTKIPFSDNKCLQEKYILDPLHKSSLRENLTLQKDESQISTKTNVSLSEYSFNTFYENAKATINKMKIKQNLKDEKENSSGNKVQESSVEYSEDFESEKQIVKSGSTENNITSISELIEDFTQIEYGISMFSKQFSETSLEASGHLKKFGESTNSSSSQNTKKTFNNSLWPMEESIVPTEQSGESAFTQNEEVRAVSNKLKSTKEKKITFNQKNQVHIKDISEERSKHISSTNMGGEIVSNENISSEYNAKLTGICDVESDQTILIEILPSKSQNEDSGGPVNISSEPVLKIFTSSNDMTQHNVNIEHNKDPTEETLNSEIDSLFKKTPNFISDMDDNLNAGNIASEQISVKNKETNLSVENNELNIKRKIDEYIGGEHHKSLVSESLEYNQHNLEKLNSSDKIEFISKTDAGMLEQIGELIGDTPESTFISQIINTEKVSIDELSEFRNENEENSKAWGENSNQKAAFQVVGELNPLLSKAKKADNPPKLFNDEQEQAIINIPSFEREETYQDIPSIENYSELYVSEIKSDDTINKNISDIDDVSELILQKEATEFETDVEEFKDTLKNSESINTSIDNNKILTNDSDQKIPYHLHQEIPCYNVNEKNFESKLLSAEIESASSIESFDEVIGAVVISDNKENKSSFVESENISGITEEKRATKSELILPSSSLKKYKVEKLLDESYMNSTFRDVDKSARNNGSSESYTDDFDEDKDDISFVQENSFSAQKSTLDSTLRIEGHEKSSDVDKADVLMVKIDLTMDPSKREAKIVLIKENSIESSDNGEKLKGDGINHEDKKLKLPVQQRVSEMLANTVESQKSPTDKKAHRQEYHVTTYEDITPVNSPESASPVKSNHIASINTFNNEAEELLKKQLAIELEIKHLEQQQKEQLPFVYMREIPNKPPPPYTPPSTQSNAVTILPARADDVKEICRYSAKVLYNAYLSNNLHTVTFSEIHFNAINKTQSTKECCSFVFELCREIASNHYDHFQAKKVPLWLQLSEKTRLLLGKPFTYHQLENHIHLKVRELLGFKKTNIKENLIIRWSKKKKDHVDEILVLESQAEEQDWLNYDNDELMVKNEVTDAIFDMLMSETIEIYKNIFSVRNV